jgi:hypothetical protein
MRHLQPQPQPQSTLKRINLNLIGAVLPIKAGLHGCQKLRLG